MSPDTNGQRPTPAAPPVPRRQAPVPPQRRVPLIDLVLSGALRLGSPQSAPK